MSLRVESIFFYFDTSHFHSLLVLDFFVIVIGKYEQINMYEEIESEIKNILTKKSPRPNDFT
jgi:hypothetical protein